MSSRIAAAVLLVSLLSLLAYCSYGRHETFRYAMTVRVNDNGHEIVGRSVRDQIGTIDSMNALARAVANVYPKGDAIVLPIRGRLLVVSHLGWRLDRDDCPSPEGTKAEDRCEAFHTWSPVPVFNPEMRYPGSQLEVATVHALAKSQPQKMFVPDNRLPVMLTFNGEPSLHSVEVVDPHELDKVFGPGVSLIDVSIEPASEPLTRNVKNLLPFLKKKLRGYGCSGGRPDPPTRETDLREIPRLGMGACVYPWAFTT